MNDTGRTSETQFLSENKGVAEIAEFQFNPPFSGTSSTALCKVQSAW